MKKKSLFLTAVVVLGITAATMAQVPNYIPTNGLVGWWPFNGNANDGSGNANDGIVNGALLTTDRFNNTASAYKFNGTNYISIPNPSASLNSYTISLWMKFNEIPSGLENHKTIISKGEIGEQTSNNHTFYITLFSNGWGYNGQAITFGLENTIGTNNDIFYSNLNNLVNQWSHLLMNYNNANNTIDIYINGQLFSSQILTIIPNLNNHPINIGAMNTGSPNSFFQGDIDDIGIWNRSLTPQEVIDLYNSSGCSNDLVITPQNNTSQTGGSVNFTATTSDPNPSYVWQSDFGQGFQTLNNFGNYSGVNTSTLTISNLQFANHLQQIRAISTSGNCIDSSSVATITLTDACINYITVTDTLIINTTVSVLSPPNNVNTIKVYPNPASTHITIDYGDYILMNGYTFLIVNALGQTMYTTPINQQSSYIDLTSWTGNGLYFVQVIDVQGNMIENRKIVLQ